MIARSLARRLEQLESRFVPVGEPIVINVQYVDKDRNVVDRVQITLAAPTADYSGPRARRWQRT